MERDESIGYGELTFAAKVSVEVTGPRNEIVAVAHYLEELGFVTSGIVRIREHRNENLWRIYESCRLEHLKLPAEAPTVE